MGFYRTALPIAPHFVRARQNAGRGREDYSTLPSALSAG